MLDTFCRVEIVNGLASLHLNCTTQLLYVESHITGVVEDSPPNMHTNQLLTISEDDEGKSSTHDNES